MTTFNISSRPRSSHSTVLHIKANPKERSVKKADNEKRILAAAQSHFPGEVVEITTNPDDQSFGIFVGAEREHCYRAHETPPGYDFEQMDTTIQQKDPYGATPRRVYSAIRAPTTEPPTNISNHADAIRPRMQL